MYKMEEVGDFEPEFVGREEYIQKLDKAWEAHTIFGVFGVKAVGKSRLVREFLRRKKIEMTESLEVGYMDMKFYETTVESLRVCLGQLCKASIRKECNWKEYVMNAVVDKLKERRLVIVFDNADSFLENDIGVHDEFMSLCMLLIKYCNHGLKIIVTSTVRFRMLQMRHAFYQLEVSTMTHSETIQLLRQEATDIDLGYSGEVLAALCRGMPNAALTITAELKENNNLLHPNEMADILRDKQMHTRNSQIDGVGKQLQSRHGKDKPTCTEIQDKRQGRETLLETNREPETSSDAVKQHKQRAISFDTISITTLKTKNENDLASKSEPDKHDVKECRGLYKMPSSRWNFQQESGVNPNSFCEYCGKTSLIANTAVADATSFQSSTDTIMNVPSKTIRQLQMDNIKNFDVWTRTHDFNGLVALRRPAKVSESVCTCEQCKKLS